MCVRENTENGDGIRGEDTFNHVWKHGLLFFGRCWLWLEERRCQREVIERDTSSALMSVRLAGPLMSTFLPVDFFPQGFSKSLNVLYVIVRVRSPSVTTWTSAKENSKSSHLVPSLSAHRARTIVGPSVLCCVRCNPGNSAKGGSLLCFDVLNDCWN